LCDCFLDFGQVIAEMTMLLAFVLFGALLSTMLGQVPLLATLALAGLAIFVIRPLVVWSVLRLGRAGLSRYARQFIGWFGPRGLNSLLFALLVVAEAVPGGEQLFAVVGVVVLVSVVAHGVTATPFSRWYARKASQETLVEERAATAAEPFAQSPDDVRRVTPAQLSDRLAGRCWRCRSWPSAARRAAQPGWRRARGRRGGQVASARRSPPVGVLGGTPDTYHAAGLRGGPPPQLQQAPGTISLAVSDVPCKRSALELPGHRPPAITSLSPRLPPELVLANHLQAGIVATRAG
jgi:hypothetical protein